jgi:heptosyltransferase-2
VQHKISIELPTWLGDTIMATPAIMTIINHYSSSSILLIGSPLSTQAIAPFPNVKYVIVDESKKTKFRPLGLWQLSRQVGSVDIAFSFRRSSASKLLMWLLSAKQKYQYSRKYITEGSTHQAQYYQDFINDALGIKGKTQNLQLHHKKMSYQRPTIGINAGATYGSVKRWYPERFAEVAIHLSSEYDIVLFGGPAEVEMVGDIEALLQNAGVSNYYNLAGKTSVDALIERISGLALLITNDSGPMHVAAAYHVPTVAIFGPTNFTETSQWQNPKSELVRVPMECSPCMQRTCPLGHHECMTKVTSEMVIESANRVLS